MSKTLTMNFHLAGVVSHEDYDVINEDEKTITLGDLNNSETEWVFNKKTGKCLNDDTTFGARRSIKPIQILTD